jgi:hypothetical protein
MGWLRFAVMMSSRFWLALVLLGSLLIVPGCSRPTASPLAPAEERLLKFGNAYINATYQNQGRAPRSFDEIKKYLEGEDTADYMRSPGDGEPFVVHWGVDFTNIVSSGPDPFTIAAYERTGVDGKRWVLRFPRSVVQMTDEELRKAVFPPGHKPPP